MWFRLALALGYPTVEALQEDVNSEQFTEWQAYFQIEPFGFPVDEWRWGMLAANICNAVRSTIPLPKGARRPKMLKASDFFLTRKESDLTPEQQAHIERKRKQKRG